MDNKQLHQYAVTYHCGNEWGEEMLQSDDLSHAVEAAHAIFPSSCRTVSYTHLTLPTILLV